ncbi:MAG TPA: hypothetical protein VMY77_16355 [Chitinophagaceae bacterium]|nr:hypothetical protein [Chitinophagaceae bacterium]
MRYTIIISILALLIYGCKKDKYTTVPQLKYKSVNTKQLHRGETLVFTLSFTDKEGDLTDKLIFQKVVKNCSRSNFIDSSNAVPTFPSGKNQAGELLVTLTYNDVNPQCSPRNDTAIFKFLLRDKALNKSDTAVSDQIIIYN